MKNTKKLLILVLSLVLLIGALVTVAAAEGSEKVSVTYPDGTVVEYAEGETITPPEGTTYAGKGNTLYLVSAAGWSYSLDGEPLDDLTVTANMIGKNIVANAELTQVYYTVTAGTEVEYVTENNLVAYAAVVKHGGAEIKLYKDISFSGFTWQAERLTAANASNATYKEAMNAKYYFDLNGHTITSTGTGNIFNLRAAYLYVYSSQPGARIDAPKATLAYPNNDDYTVSGYTSPDGAKIKPSGKLYIGDRSTAKAEFNENLTVVCAKMVPDTLYGSSVTICGGTYVQGEGSAVAHFLQMGRVGNNGSSHVQDVKNAAFVLTNPATAPVHLQCGADRTFTNCIFISPNTDGVDLSDFPASKMPKKTTFVDCKFINVKSFAESADKIAHKNSAFGGVAPMPPAGQFLAHGVAETFTVNGNEYSVEMQFVSDVSDALCVNWNDTFSDYWLVGTTPYFAASPSLFTYCDTTQDPVVYYYDPVFDTSSLTQVTPDQLGTVKKMTASFSSSSPVALYWENEAGVVGFVPMTEGMTAAEIGQAFYDKFDKADGGYKITLYADIVLPAAMGWGPLGTVNDPPVPEYKSLTKGSIVLDLNGYTITIPGTITAGINVSNSNNRNLYAAASEAIFGFEVDAGANTFTLKSSRPGAKILNNTEFALFAVGEGAKATIVIDGANITYEGKGSVTHLIEASDATAITVNGGRYVINSSRPAFSAVGTLKVKDAEIVMLGDAPVSFVASHSWKRKTTISFESCLIYCAAQTPLFKIVGNNFNVGAPGDNATVYSLSFKDCMLLGGIAIVSSAEHLDNLTYSDNYTASAETALIANPSAAVAAKIYKDVTVAGVTEEYLLYLGVNEADALKVYYEGIAPTEYYLPGSPFRPLAAEALKDVYFDLENGIFVDIEGYKSPMLFDVVTVDMKDSVINAVANINYVEKPMASAVLVNGEVESFALLSSEAYAQELVDAIAAAAEGAVVRLYVSTVAPAAVESTAAITLDLNGYTLYLSAAVKAGAPLTVKNGAVVLTADAAALFEGAVVVEDASVFNVAAEAAFTTVSAEVRNAKIYNLSLANVVFGGKVLHTDASIFDATNGNHALNTTGGEVLVVGEDRYVLSFGYAVSDDIGLICYVTFFYKEEMEATKKYLAGSVPSYAREVVEGYYISYAGTAPVYENASLNCIFSADSDKLKAELIVTERLNFIFYLQKQEGLENLTFAGIALDMDALDTVVGENGEEYFVLPYEFISIANSLDVITLTVDVYYGENVYETVEATVSVIDYALGILGDLAAEDDEKQLVYSLLAYVDAMLDYFEKPGSEALTQALSDYAEYRVAYVAPEAEKITSDYVRGALYIVNENLDLALRVDPDFKGELIVSLPDGTARTFIYKDIVSMEGHSYIVVENVAFADAGAGLDIEVKMYGETVESFNYSIANYAQAMGVQNMGYTPVYVKALYNFVSLAARSVG